MRVLIHVGGRAGPRFAKRGPPRPSFRTTGPGRSRLAPRAAAEAPSAPDLMTSPCCTAEHLPGPDLGHLAPYASARVRSRISRERERPRPASGRRPSAGRLPTWCRPTREEPASGTAGRRRALRCTGSWGKPVAGLTAAVFPRRPPSARRASALPRRPLPSARPPPSPSPRRRAPRQAPAARGVGGRRLQAARSRPGGWQWRPAAKGPRCGSAARCPVSAPPIHAAPIHGRGPAAGSPSGGVYLIMYGMARSWCGTI